MKILPFSRFIVHGHSMLPILKPGDSVLGFNWAYFFKKPKKGDVVIFKDSERMIIKRIIEIDGINIKLAGDNKNDSKNFGWINKSQIQGVVIGI